MYLPAWQLPDGCKSLCIFPARLLQFFCSWILKECVISDCGKLEITTNAAHNDSQVSNASQDSPKPVCMGWAFLIRVTAAVLVSKCSMLCFLIAIYHSRICKLFHFLKSAEWCGFGLRRSALCHEMGAGSVPLMFAIKAAGDSTNSRKSRGNIRPGNH